MPCGLPTEATSLPSCNGCKHRKLKCSRDMPACANCKRLDSVCEYDRYKSKPGMKSGIVDKLTRRIEELEHKLYDGKNSRELPGTSSPPSFTRHQVAAQRTESLGLTAELGCLSKAIQTLNGNVGMLAAAISMQDDSNATQVNARKRRKVGTGCAGEHRPSQDVSTETPQSQPTNQSLDILEETALLVLVDAFFLHIGRSIPMLQEKAFRRSLLKRKSGDPLPLIVHAMIVSSIRIVQASERLFSEADVVERIEHAMAKITLTANSNLSVESLQSLIIVAYTLLISGEHTKAWPIIGSLTRSVEYLQLNVEEQDREELTALLHPVLLSKSIDWIEEEERRRVFWNVFILDRMCSVMAGYRIGLTGDNVSRRLPLCGTYWNTDTFGISPYFDIWDKSVAQIGNSIASLPQHYSSPDQRTAASATCSGGTGTERTSCVSPVDNADMSKVGAFAYYIEALESLCQIDTYFLRQKVDFTSRSELARWLTRFKELDMRLVQWKSLLPSKWRDPDVPTAETGRLDPNMTLAHITHNSCMILLHQRIGYLEEQPSCIKLPKFFSAETCRLAAAETAAISRAYLASSSELMPLSPHFCFCLCISARALLVHCQHYGPELDSFFWVLLAALDEAAKRCHTSSNEDHSLAGQLAAQLRQLHLRMQEPNFRLHVLDSFNGSNKCYDMPRQVRNINASAGDSSTRVDESLDCTKLGSVQEIHGTVTPFPCFSSPLELLNTSKSKTTNLQQTIDPGSPSHAAEPPLLSRLDCDTWTEDYLSSLLDGFDDSAFTDMDRVIGFADIDFTVSWPD